MSAVPQSKLLLSADAYRRIDREAAKFPPEQRRSTVMAALAIAQDELGWLSKEAIEEVADYLGMPPIAVYEVATFYTMYNLKPGWPSQDRDLYQSAVRAVGCHTSCRAPEATAWHRLQRNNR